MYLKRLFSIKNAFFDSSPELVFSVNMSLCLMSNMVSTSCSIISNISLSLAKKREFIIKQCGSAFHKVYGDELLDLTEAIKILHPL